MSPGTVIPLAAATADLVPPPPTLAIRKREFAAWVERAPAGARIEYHRGHLAVDRIRGFSPYGERERRELDAIAKRALALAEEGRLLLVQQRHGAGDYSYLAVKAKHPSAGRSVP